MPIFHSSKDLQQLDSSWSTNSMVPMNGENSRKKHTTAPFPPSPAPLEGDGQGEVGLDNTHEIWICTTCELSFPSTRALDDHSTRHHPEDLPCVCRLCDSRFLTDVDLGTHIKIAHIQGRKDLPKSVREDSLVKRGHHHHHHHKHHHQNSLNNNNNKPTNNKNLNHHQRNNITTNNNNNCTNHSNRNNVFSTAKTHICTSNANNTNTNTNTITKNHKSHRSGKKISRTTNSHHNNISHSNISNNNNNNFLDGERPEKRVKLVSSSETTTTKTGAPTALEPSSEFLPTYIIDEDEEPSPVYEPIEDDFPVVHPGFYSHPRHCNICNVQFSLYEDWREHAVFFHIFNKNPYPIVEMNYVSVQVNQRVSAREYIDSFVKFSSGVNFSSYSNPSPPGNLYSVHLGDEVLHNNGSNSSGIIDSGVNSLTDPNNSNCEINVDPNSYKDILKLTICRTKNKGKNYVVKKPGPGLTEQEKDALFNDELSMPSVVVAHAKNHVAPSNNDIIISNNNNSTVSNNASNNNLSNNISSSSSILEQRLKRAHRKLSNGQNSESPIERECGDKENNMPSETDVLTTSTTSLERERDVTQNSTSSALKALERYAGISIESVQTTTATTPVSSMRKPASGSVVVIGSGASESEVRALERAAKMVIIQNDVLHTGDRAASEDLQRHFNSKTNNSNNNNAISPFHNPIFSKTQPHEQSQRVSSTNGNRGASLENCSITQSTRECVLPNSSSLAKEPPSTAVAAPSASNMISEHISNLTKDMIEFETTPAVGESESLESGETGALTGNEKICNKTLEKQKEKSQSIPVSGAESSETPEIDGEKTTKTTVSSPPTSGKSSQVHGEGEHVEIDGEHGKETGGDGRKGVASASNLNLEEGEVQVEAALNLHHHSRPSDSIPSSNNNPLFDNPNSNDSDSALHIHLADEQETGHGHVQETQERFEDVSEDEEPVSKEKRKGNNNSSNRIDGENENALSVIVGCDENTGATKDTHSATPTNSSPLVDGDSNNDRDDNEEKRGVGPEDDGGQVTEHECENEHAEGARVQSRREEHEQDGENDNDFQCRVCGQEFESDEEVKSHFSSAHFRVGVSSSILEPESPAPPQQQQQQMHAHQQLRLQQQQQREHGEQHYIHRVLGDQRREEALAHLLRAEKHGGGGGSSSSSHGLVRPAPINLQHHHLAQQQQQQQLRRMEPHHEVSHRSVLPGDVSPLANSNFLRPHHPLAAPNQSPNFEMHHSQAQTNNARMNYSVAGSAPDHRTPMVMGPRGVMIPFLPARHSSGSSTPSSSSSSSQQHQHHGQVHPSDAQVHSQFPTSLHQALTNSGQQHRSQQHQQQHHHHHQQQQQQSRSIPQQHHSPHEAANGGSSSSSSASSAMYRPQPQRAVPVAIHHGTFRHPPSSSSAPSSTSSSAQQQSAEVMMAISNITQAHQQPRTQSIPPPNLIRGYPHPHVHSAPPQSHPNHDPHLRLSRSVMPSAEIVPPPQLILGKRSSSTELMMEQNVSLSKQARVDHRLPRDDGSLHLVQSEASVRTRQVQVAPAQGPSQHQHHQQQQQLLQHHPSVHHQVAHAQHPHGQQVQVQHHVVSPAHHSPRQVQIQVPAHHASPELPLRNVAAAIERGGVSSVRLGNAITLSVCPSSDPSLLSSNTHSTSRPSANNNNNTSGSSNNSSSSSSSNSVRLSSQYLNAATVTNALAVRGVTVTPASPPAHSPGSISDQNSPKSSTPCTSPLPSGQFSVIQRIERSPSSISPVHPEFSPPNVVVASSSSLSHAQNPNANTTPVAHHQFAVPRVPPRPGHHPQSQSQGQSQIQQQQQHHIPGVDRPDRPPTVDLTDDDVLHHLLESQGRPPNYQHPHHPHHSQQQQQHRVQAQAHSIQNPGVRVSRQILTCNLCHIPCPSAQALEEHRLSAHGYGQLQLSQTQQQQQQQRSHRQPGSSGQPFVASQPQQQQQQSQAHRSMEQLHRLQQHHGPHTARHSSHPSHTLPLPQLQQMRPRSPSTSTRPPPAPPTNSGANDRKRHQICIPLLDLSRLDNTKLRILDEIGITNFIPLQGNERTIEQLGIPIMNLQLARGGSEGGSISRAGQQLGFLNSFLPLGPVVATQHVMDPANRHSI